MAFSLTPLPEFLSLQNLQETPAIALHALDTGLGGQTMYQQSGSEYAFSGTSESFHFGSCAEMDSVVLSDF